MLAAKTAAMKPLKQLKGGGKIRNEPEVKSDWTAEIGCQKLRISKAYSQELCELALTLFHYSPRAYNHLAMFILSSKTH